MANDSDHSKNSQFLLGFLLGALIGAATALFSDTTKGTKLRKDLVNKAKEALKDLPDLLDSQAPGLAKQLTSTTKKAVEKLPSKKSPDVTTKAPVKEEAPAKEETLNRVRRFFKRSQKTP
jgi:gas vesicle protein